MMKSPNFLKLRSCFSFFFKIILFIFYSYVDATTVLIVRERLALIVVIETDEKTNDKTNDDELRNK
jgi:hypothetical protein